MTTYPKYKVTLIGPGRCSKCLERADRARVDGELKMLHFDGKQWVEHECPKRMAA